MLRQAAAIALPVTPHLETKCVLRVPHMSQWGGTRYLCSVSIGHSYLSHPIANPTLAARFNLQDRLAEVLIVHDRDIAELEAPCPVGP